MRHFGTSPNITLELGAPAFLVPSLPAVGPG